MTKQASTRIALGSVMAAVATTANTVTGVLDAANAGVGMLNTIVTDAAKKQAARSKLDNEDFMENLIREKAMESTLSLKAIKEFIEVDEFNKTNYESSYIRYSTILGRTTEPSA